MVRVYTCSFCGTGIQPGSGMWYVRVDGTILRFCSSKCFKNALKLRRDPSKLKWTLVYGKKEASRTLRASSR
ncbi:MAG: 50S ribosomal protein L24e [Thermofilaceae archaeon]|nr:50S ribosomal protein L24e [Thermofilaceae archaeon]MDW8003642.1 50S ribosomal protein L24e [Thermofilaceae archaeon]